MLAPFRRLRGHSFTWSLAVALAAAAFACGTRTDLGAPDSGADETTAPVCRPDDPFISVGPVGGDLTSAGNDSEVRLAPDELTAYFISNRFRTAGGYDALVAHRASASYAFTNATILPGLAAPNSGANDPNVTADGLDVLFEGACVTGPTVPIQLCGAHRNSPSVDFGAPFTVAVGTPQDVPARFAGQVYALPDGNTIYFQADNLGGQHTAVGRATRASRTDPFGSIGQVEISPGPAGTDFDTYPVVTSDETTIFFGRFSVASQANRIWVASRPTLSGPFENAQPVPALTHLDAFPNWISPDGCRLYLTTSFPTDAGGTRTEIWVAIR